MKRLWILPILLMFGCATPSKVQEMIDSNNQKIAAEQLKPEFDRISEQFAEISEQFAGVESQLTALNDRLDVLEQVSARSEEKVLNLSLALNKAQGDMGLINQKIKEVEELVQSQRGAIDAARSSVASQNEMLLELFRRQLSGTAKVIERLEDDLKALEPAPVE